MQLDECYEVGCETKVYCLEHFQSCSLFYNNVLVKTIKKLFYVKRQNQKFILGAL